MRIASGERLMAAGSSIGKTVANIMFFLFELAFFVLLGLTYYFMSYMPVQPNPDLGLCCPFNIHGYIVYISDFQCTLMSSLFWGRLAICAFAALLNNKYSKVADGSQ